MHHLFRYRALRLENSKALSLSRILICRKVESLVKCGSRRVRGLCPWTLEINANQMIGRVKWARGHYSLGESSARNRVSIAT